LNLAPTFSITPVKDILWIKLSGRWTVAADIDYLTRLSEQMHKMRNRPWGMAIDMRDWYVSNTDKAFVSPDLANIDLDRRNQCVECWLVRHPHQAEFLVPFVSKHRSIAYDRAMNNKDAIVFLKSKVFPFSFHHLGTNKSSPDSLHNSRLTG
jgi:hypothetical protein